jgi:hypothetical protein
VDRSLAEKTAAGASDSHGVGFTSGKLTAKVSARTADVHGRQWTAISGS